MSSPIINNNYTTAPTFPNPYISRKLNNMEEVQEMKKEQNDWTKLYHKTLRKIEVMINVQKIVKNMKKLAEVANMIVTEMKESILMTSINNQITNAMNILQISEDL